MTNEPVTHDAAIDAWRELVEKDDRTSPKEYPEMALITQDELVTFISDTVEKAVAEKDRRIAELEQALEPFAKAADVKLCGQWKDDEHFGRTDVTFYLTFGHLRRARELLPLTPPAQGEG